MDFYCDMSSFSIGGLGRCQEVDVALSGSDSGTLLTVSLAGEARYTAPLTFWRLFIISRVK